MQLLKYGNVKNHQVVKGYYYSVFGNKIGIR